MFNPVIIGRRPYFAAKLREELPYSVDNTTIIYTNGVLSAVGGAGSGNVSGPASAVSGHVATFNGATGKIIQDGGVLPAGSNPIGTASDTAQNGSATTFMRSDATPAVQKGSSSQFGLIKVDGTTITATGGVISASASGSGNVNGPVTSTVGHVALWNNSGGTALSDGGALATVASSGSYTDLSNTPAIPSAANPTATATTTVTNGSATTFMRSDGAPALPTASSSVFGVAKVDGTTITAAGGIISAVGGGASGNPLGHPGYIAGNSYLPWQGSTAAGSAPTANIARFIPFIPAQSITISALSVRVTTLGTSNYQTAVYASNTTTKKPTGTPLATTASQANTSPGTFTTVLSGNISLTAGTLYWLAHNCNDAIAIYVVATPETGPMPFWLGSATLNSILLTAGSNALSFYSTPMTFGTWSDVTSATWTEVLSTAYAIIAPKVLSIP